MSFREITLAGERIWLLPGGTVFLPETQTLVVADLHLGKGTSARSRGLLLPPGDTISTLEKLLRLVEVHSPRLLVALGDSFHDSQAGDRLLDVEKRMLDDLATKVPVRWITGNHDAVPVEGVPGDWREDQSFGKLILRHVPCAKVPVGKAELAGHLHPKIKARIRGHVISRPCFLKGMDRLILPALGTYTGGLEMSDPAFKSLFTSGAAAYVWSAKRVCQVSSP